MLYIDPLDRVTMNILTSFPFTFKLAVPGLSNPFTSLSTSPTTGTNPPRMPPPASSFAPSQRDFCQEHEERPSRSLARPTRPLPMSIGSNSMLGTSLRRPNPNPSFSPSPSPAPSASHSLAHPYGTHLSPQKQHSHLSPYQQWQVQQQQQQQGQATSQRFSSSPAPLSRKRGWGPSNSSPSCSQTTLASTSGYLDPPAKLRDLAERMEVVHVDEARELDSDDLPPTKRRRGLAGSIVETAWSAALLGTAVGLSVYRLWRGQPGEDNVTSQAESATPSRKRRAARSTSRDDDDDMVMSMDACPPSPPPPYNHEWTAVDYPRSIPITPSRKAGKAKTTTPRAAAAKKMGPVRRTQHTKVTQISARAGPSRHPPTADPAFDFSFGASNSGRPIATTRMQCEETLEDIDVDVEDQMDWLGGKLAQLIEEGKKALKTEVVVMSEAREDEVDDGSGAWVSDEEEQGRRTKHMRRGSTASIRQRRGTPQPSVSQMHTPEPSPRKSQQTSRPVSVFDGAGDSCESPEVREMMERARAKFSARISVGR